jgi:hypothetical protein
VLRAVIMLGCVVAIPIMALSGSTLPAAIQDLLAGRWPGKGAKDAHAAPLTPQFEPVPTANAQPALLIEQRTPNPLAAPPRELGPWAGGPTATPPSPVVQTGYDAPVPAAPLPSVTPLPPAGPGGLVPPYSPPSHAAPAPGSDPFGPPAAGPRPLVPVTPSDPYPTELRQPLVPAAPAVAAPPENGEQFTRYQEWLRQQGATYFLLETWGGQQQLYRFYCKMAVGGNPNCTRHFEATNADPLRAMAEVVAQIEAGRASGL